jgi:hypothetical protein
MPVSNLLVTANGSAQLHHFNDDVVVRLALPAEKLGVWMLIGRVVISNGDGDQQLGSARLTTNDGATVLDLVDDLYLPFNTPTPVSLQGFLRPGEAGEPIVDLRCSTYNGVANWGKLFALLVDDVRPE